MGVLDWLNQHIAQPAEQAVGNSLSAAKNVVLNDLVHPVENAVNPMANGAAGQAVDFLNNHFAQPVANFASTATGAAARALITNPIFGGQTAGSGDEQFNQPPPVPQDPRAYNQQALGNFVNQGNNGLATQVGSFTGNALPFFINPAGAAEARIGAQIGNAAGNYSSGSGLQNNIGNLSKDVGESFVNNSPSIPLGGLTEGLAPAARFVANSTIAGTENVARNQANSLIETGKPDTDLQNNLIQFGVGAGIHSALHPGEALGAIKSPLQAVGNYTDNVANQKAYQGISDLYNKEIPNEPVLANGQQVHQNGEPLTQPKDVITSTVPVSVGDQMLKEGKYTPSILPAGSNDGPTITVHADPKTGEIISWGTDDPNYLSHVNQQAQSPTFGKYQPSSREELTRINQVRGQEGDINATPSLEGAQFRQQPQPIEELLQTAQENGAKTIETPYNQADVPQVARPGEGSFKDQARSAISAKLAAEAKVEQSAKIAIQAAKSAGLNEVDANLFRDSVEHPEDLQRNISQTNDPAKFQQALERYRGFTNDVYKVGAQAGRDYPYRTNYLNHEYDLSELHGNQGANDEFNQLIKQKAGSNAFSTSELPKVFQDYRESTAYGKYLQDKYGLENNPFAPKNASMAEDIRDLAVRSKRAVGASAFVQELKRVSPGQVVEGSKEVVPRGFMQLRVPGLDDTFVSPELHKYLTPLEPSAFVNNPIIKAVDTANRTLKGVVLQGPFHAIKETINFTGDQLFGLKMPNFVEAAHIATSADGFASHLLQAKESGLLDFANNSNLKLGGTDFENLNKSNFSMHSMTFDRLLPYYKLESFRTAVEREGLNMNTPEGIAAGKKVAEQVNNFYGGLNNELNGRNKTTQQLLRFATLAPDFNEGKLRTGANAVLDWNSPAGNLARKQLAGSLAVTALSVALARRFSTGKFDDLKGMLQNDILNPNIPLPSQFNKPGSTIQQTAQVPASVAGDLYRLATNPAQAIQSRGSSLLSLGQKIYTGKDYYGNPLVNPFQNPNPSMLDNAKAVWKSELPIPAQNALNAVQGKISPAAAVVNAIGGRVANNPDDPKQIANTQYYNNLSNFTSSLNPNQKSLFSTLNPTKKDQDGNPVFDKSTVTSSANAAQLASQPDFAQKYADFQRQNGSPDPIYQLKGNDLINALQARAATGLANKSSLDPNAPSASNSASIYLHNFSLFQGQQALEKLAGNGNYDPLYNLSDSQAKQVLYVRTLSGVEATGDPTVKAIKAQGWYKPFLASEQQFYNDHPIPQTASSASQAPYPQMPTQLSQYAQYIAGLSTPKAKALAYQTPQGQALDQYYNQLNQYTSTKQANLLGTSLNVPATKYAPGYVANPNSVNGTTGALTVNPASTSSSSSGSSVSQALATSAAHRGARKIIAASNKATGIHANKVSIPKLTSKSSSHGRIHAPHVSSATVKPTKPIGKVNRPASRA